MTTDGKVVLRMVWLALCVILADVTLVLAQGSMATLTGRVVDEMDAVLPGVTITATNTSTNITRTTVTNEVGLYRLAGLEPGVYAIQAQLSGFANTTRTGVMLAVNQTISIDVSLSIAGLAENVTVSGTSPLVEATQSLLSSTVRTREVENLPLLTRNVNGLLALTPGAKTMAPPHPAKRQWGAVSFGGSTGRNTLQIIDGADNRDNILGGALLPITIEGVEEFQVASHQFSAADGRTGGATVTLVTKSGTNTFKGSGFAFNRNQGLTAKDYFTKQANQPELPYSRQQYGGSLGGPIVKNRAFFFGAAEPIRENQALTIPDRQYSELQLLVPFGAVPARSVVPTYRQWLYTTKANVELKSNQSLVARLYYQTSKTVNADKTAGRDVSVTRHDENSGWDFVVQHSWTPSNRVLNQFLVHRSHSFILEDNDYWFRDWPSVPTRPAGMNLNFPSVQMGALGAASFIPQDMWQFKDTVTLQLESHALRIGGDYSWMPKFGAQFCSCWAAFTFFDDPSVIVSNSNGRYPQGFQTPGAMASTSAGAPDGVHYSGNVMPGYQVKAYFQDDWRVRPRLTLNLGVRYDIDYNFYDQQDQEQNLTGRVLRAIGSPYGGFVRTPTKDISPRVGFAYDIRGDGQRVLRGGYGLYFDGTGINAATGTMTQDHRPWIVSRTLVNTAVGVGQLANYRFGIDPPPPNPPAVTGVDQNFPPGANSNGSYINPEITDPRNHQVHVGYVHQLMENTVLSVDYTHIKGVNDLKNITINDFVNGVRPLAADLARVYGDPNLLGGVTINSSIGKSRYDELAVQLERRLARATLRVSYTLSGAFAYGGVIEGSANVGPPAQDMGRDFAPGEWGPTTADERHRVVVFGVFDLPYGLQVSPSFQAATARPYNLTAGADLNRDGRNVDRYVDPSQPGTFQPCPSCPVVPGKQVSVNSQRGDPFSLLDVRVSKFVRLGQNRQVSVFAEFFNIFNTVNFGQSYNGNGLSRLFNQPIGYIPGSGYPFQVQLGARVQF